MFNMEDPSASRREEQMKIGFQEYTEMSRVGKSAETERLVVVSGWEEERRERDRSQVWVFSLGWPRCSEISGDGCTTLWLR